MTLPKEQPHLTPHGETLGGTLDEAMAAELLRPLFNGVDSKELLEVGRKAMERALRNRGLIMGTPVSEPSIIYSLSSMDRQLRFDIYEQGGHAEDGAAEPESGDVLMQGCIRLLGRLACHRMPHECNVSIQLMVGKADASTYFAYHDRPSSWLIQESPLTPLLRQVEHAESLPKRWPAALTVMSSYLSGTGPDELCNLAFPERSPLAELSTNPARQRGSTAGN